MRLNLFLLALAVVSVTQVASAQTCVGDVPFNQWLEGVKQEVLKKGITQETLASALPKMTHDAALVEKTNKRQKAFQESFITFVNVRANEARIAASKRKIKEYKEIFDRTEKQYGIPAELISAFWGLESDHGAALKLLNFNVLSSVTTLACDPRRSEMFREQLYYLLLLLQKKYVTLDQMQKGNWAGEFGGMQFMAKDFIEYGVVADGDPKKTPDIINNPADTILSAGNYLNHKGWKAGEPWLQEVSVPQNLKWEEADLAIQHSVKQWQDWGVKAKAGELANPNLKAALLLPMGRKGPAFLAYPNFSLFTEWNEALKYSITAAYLATRVAGAAKMDESAKDLPMLTTEQVIELQTILQSKGYDVGDIDGILGAKTRPSIKAEQLRLGLPADSYPDAELLKRLKN